MENKVSSLEPCSFEGHLNECMGQLWEHERIEFAPQPVYCFALLRCFANAIFSDIKQSRTRAVFPTHVISINK